MLRGRNGWGEFRSGGVGRGVGLGAVGNGPRWCGGGCTDCFQWHRMRRAGAVGAVRVVVKWGLNHDGCYAGAKPQGNN
ncbi:MAG: hypothetical protein CM15mV3_2990 [Caudoviricetes sp.]|nr:MAG: hypothetical protein CM15mV3_2990 [Caudoviricetes sp.]